MNLQVLVSTMHQEDYSLLEKMKIQSDVIIVNQCDKNEFEEFEYNGHSVKFISLAERGIGLSRNTALMRTTSDISIFADDDVIYEDGYVNIVIEAFKKNPKADIILFNVLSTNPERPSFVITNKERIRTYNCLKYGTVRIAARTKKLKEANIYFSLLFGGGAKYSAGEDSLFIIDCLRNGLKIYSTPEIIGYVSQEDSCWFQGYTDKYFFDKGAFYSSLSRKWARLLALQYVVRHNKKWRNQITIRKAYKLMSQGINEVE